MNAVVLVIPLQGGMVMKLNVNRETTIGLSVLLVLLAILAGVAAWRFTRSHVPAEALLAREENRGEEPIADRSHWEAEFHAKPASLTPAEPPDREKLRSLDDPSHCETAKEKKRDLSADFPASGLVVAAASEADSPPAHAESKKEQREAARDFASGHARSAETDDRYSVTAAAPSAEPRARGNSGSMVIQVSDSERPDRGPQSSDRYGAPERFRLQRPSGNSWPRPMARRPACWSMPRWAAVARKTRRNTDFMPTACRQVGIRPAIHTQPRGHRLCRKARVRARRGLSGPPGNVPPNYAGRPIDAAAANYAAAPRGYEPDNSLRRDNDALYHMRGQDRPRNDGSYEVQPNDSYWTISEKVYGSGAYFAPGRTEPRQGRPARPPPAGIGDFHASGCATGEGLSGLLPSTQSPRNGAEPG